MTESTVINLTPHDINVISHKSYIDKTQAPKILLTLPPSGMVARCIQITDKIDQLLVNGIYVDITAVCTDRVVNLPDPEPGVLYIVSKIVAEYLIGIRSDLLVTHGLYKQDKRTIGCRSFIKY